MKRRASSESPPAIGKDDRSNVGSAGVRPQHIREQVSESSGRFLTQPPQLTRHRSGVTARLLGVTVAASNAVCALGTTAQPAMSALPVKRAKHADQRESRLPTVGPAPAPLRHLAPDERVSPTPATQFRNTTSTYLNSIPQQNGPPIFALFSSWHKGHLGHDLSLRPSLASDIPALPPFPLLRRVVTLPSEGSPFTSGALSPQSSRAPSSCAASCRCQPRPHLRGPFAASLSRPNALTRAFPG
jgi:hypothetical protein